MEKLKVLVSRNDIQRRIAELAAGNSQDYHDKNTLVIGALKGSFVFMADLIRALDTPVEVEFIRLSSYGSGLKGTG